MMEAAYAPALQQSAIGRPLTRPARKPPTYESPAPLVSTSFSFGSTTTGNSVICPFTQTIVGSQPCVITTVRFRLLALGIRDKRVAMNLMSVVSQPSVWAHVRASVSLPNKKSTKGIVSTKTALKGGTCIKNGAERFMQYTPPSFAFSSDTALMAAGETVA